MKFDRCGDVKLYLVNSLIVYDGKPVEVLAAHAQGGDRFEIKLRHLSSGADAFFTDTNDPLLEMESPTLGYINYGGQASYLQREPVRRYKRGLSCENVKSQHFSAEGVLSVFENNYPSFSTAMDSVKHGVVTSCAFSSNFAIDKDTLYFKKRKVGKVKDGDAKLDKKFLFLKKKLQESIDG